MNEDATNQPRYADQNYQGRGDRDHKKRESSQIEDWVKKKITRKLVSFVIRQGAMTAARTPVGLIVMAVILLLIVIIFIFFGNSRSSSTTEEPEDPPIVVGSPSQPPIQGFTLSLIGPENIDNGQLLKYTINYDYDSAAALVPLESITIYYDIPQNATLENAGGSPDTPTGTVSWPLERAENQATLIFTLRPTIEDVLIVSKVYARSSAAPSGGENLPPNSDTCGGTYSLNNPVGNFGDPACNFTKDQLYAMLQELDPEYADLWYYKIIPCESSYNPNTYASHVSIGTPDPAGAWGLFQMGRGLNGQYDHGDVAWTLQVSNAINDYYKRQVPAGITSHGAYWACAR